MVLPSSSVYVQPGELYNREYPAFSVSVANMCDDISEIAEEIVNKANNGITINDFIPKINVRFFGIFAASNGAGEARDSREMDGPSRALSLIAGGLVAGLASFVFGSFFSDFQEARIRLARCEEFKERHPNVWRIHDDENIDVLRRVIEAEERLAYDERRSALVNMALTVAVIGAGALLIVAAIFASVPTAIGASLLLVTIGIVAMAKFGFGFFDKMPARKAQRILDGIDYLKRVPQNLEEAV